MAVEIDLTPNPLDYVPAGDLFVVGEGQLVVKGPIFVAGELFVEENAHLIVE